MRQCTRRVFPCYEDHRHPERDAVILWLGFSCGLRVTETARLTVADALLPSGRLKSET